jgi:hypothetical protein
VQPGEETTVDLPVSPGTAPGFSSEIAVNIVGGAVTNDTGIEDPRPYPNTTRIRMPGSDVDRLYGSSGLLHYLGDIEVVLTPIDAAGNPTGDPCTGAYVGTGPDLRFFRFPDCPLTDGDRVRVSIDPDQEALAGLAPLSATSFDLLYQDGFVLDAVEFRFHPVRDIGGRVFLERKDPDGAYDKADKPLHKCLIRLWDLDAAADDDPIAETETDNKGLFVFEDVPQGLYLITLGKGDRTEIPSQVRLVFAPGDPAPVSFAMTSEDKWGWQIGKLFDWTRWKSFMGD